MKNKINDMTAYFQRYMIELFDSPTKLNFTDKFVHWIFEFGMSRTLYFSLLSTAEMLVFKAQIREQMFGPDLHVFTFKFLALKKVFSGSKKPKKKFFYKKGIMQLFSADAIVF